MMASAPLPPGVDKETARKRMEARQAECGRMRALLNWLEMID